jgi:hypothetical protein
VNAGAGRELFDDHIDDGVEENNDDDGCGNDGGFEDDEKEEEDCGGGGGKIPGRCGSAGREKGTVGGRRMKIAAADSPCGIELGVEDEVDDDGDGDGDEDEDDDSDADGDGEGSDEAGIEEVWSDCRRVGSDDERLILADDWLGT